MSKKLEDRDISVNEIHRLMRAHPEIDWKKIITQIIQREGLSREKEKELWMAHAHRHAVETGWSEAHELFEF